MTGETTIEAGRYGRMAALRLRPNQDLVEAIEAACLEHGIEQGLIRSALGSLTDASFDYGEGGHSFVEGPGLEIVSMAGDLRPGPDGHPCARLSGSVADRDGRVFGGLFRRGENPICITVELVLQEWIPA